LALGELFSRALLRELLKSALAGEDEASPLAQGDDLLDGGHVAAGEVIRGGTGMPRDAGRGRLFDLLLRR
jgi:hypothetical protein